MLFIVCPPHTYCIQMYGHHQLSDLTVFQLMTTHTRIVQWNNWRYSMERWAVRMQTYQLPLSLFLQSIINIIRKLSETALNRQFEWKSMGITCLFSDLNWNWMYFLTWYSIFASLFCDGLTYIHTHTQTHTNRYLILFNRQNTEISLKSVELVFFCILISHFSWNLLFSEGQFTWGENLLKSELIFMFDSHINHNVKWFHIFFLSVISHTFHIKNRLIHSLVLCLKNIISRSNKWWSVTKSIRYVNLLTILLYGQLLVYIL